MRDGTTDKLEDLWALAVMAFQMLTGALPFKGEGPQYCVAVLHDDPLSACALNPSLPASINAVFEKALCKTSDSRFRSAPTMAQAFETVLG